MGRVPATAMITVWIPFLSVDMTHVVGRVFALVMAMENNRDHAMAIDVVAIFAHGQDHARGRGRCHAFALVMAMSVAMV